MEGKIFLLLLCVSLANSAYVTVQSAYAGTGIQRVIDNFPMVSPGSTIAVTVVATNTGADAIPATVTFVPVDNTFGWTGTLTTAAAIAAGDQATFTGQIRAPNATGVVVLFLQATVAGLDFGEKANITIDVGCSAQGKCNSRSLYFNGACIAPSTTPCAFAPADGCIVDTCDSDNLCRQTQPSTSTCQLCIKNCEYLGCDGRQCGTDGCGGNCGQCEYGKYCSADGQCISASSTGTCTNPIPILASQTNLTGVYTFTANTSEGYHYHVIPCNVASTSPEIVWSFVIPTGQTYGVDFRSYNFDTVLDIRKDSCNGQYIGCNDDGTPPGNFGSRVARMLTEGTYLIIVKGYDVTQQGIVELRASFASKCIPKCNSQYCGDDECGGQCGTCGAEEHCSDTFKCVANVCTKNCTNNECGFDGCGGYCGTCTGGALCNLDTAKCENFTECNGLQPVCTGCNSTQYCGTDCQCYGVNDPLPDLFVDRDRLGADVLFDQDTFKETSCAYREGCIAGTGRRRLLRFSVLTTNQGHADIVLPSPGSRPDLFSYSPCHGHYHFVNYAYYGLLAPNGSTVVESGRKQGYCVLDGSRQSNGTINCIGTFTCASQGISIGWADTYTYDLDCQWIDITDVAPGEYLLFVELNRARKIVESNYDNNKAYVKVTIPVWNPDATDSNEIYTPTTTGVTTDSSTTDSSTTDSSTTSKFFTPPSAASSVAVGLFAVVVFVVVSLVL